jgi:NADH-quinone oxidoreductase subunit N
MFAVFTRTKYAAFVSSSMVLAVDTVLSAYLLQADANLLVFGAFHIYAFSMLFASLFSLALLLVNLLVYRYSGDYVEDLLMLSFVFIGAVLVPAAPTLLVMLVCLELITASTILMMLLSGRYQSEAAVKFFITSGIAMAVLSFALVLIFPYSVQVGMSVVGVSPSIGGDELIVLSLVLFFVALGFGGELFPFNLWVPDIYDATRSYITAMLSSINKTVALVALLEVLFVVFAAYKSTFSSIALAVSVLTMFFGNLASIAEKSIKRLLAYSSISQAGYVLIGVAVASQFGIEASLFQMIAYVFAIIGAFAIVLWLESGNLKTLGDYSGLNSRNKFAAASLTLLMLSIAGMPPLMGFMGKFLLFSSAINSTMLVLALFGILSSFISVFCYAKVISAMYSATKHATIKTEPFVVVTVAVALAVLLLFGIYPQPVIAAAQLASKALLGI